MMNTHPPTLSKSLFGSLFPLVDTETRAILALGHEQDWEFAILGKAPLPDQPVRLGDWLIIPAHQDSSQVPARALERIQAIYAAGLRPKGFVLVHEATLALPAPEGVPYVIPEMPKPRVNRKFIWIAIGLLILGLIILPAVVAFVVAALTATASLAVPAVVVVGAAIVDPILVAVTQDGYWIEIDRWWN
jgi:hypothetical protein